MANEITEFYGRSKIDEKFLAKPSGGSAGQFLKKTATGQEWGDVPPGVTLDTSMPATEPVEDNGHGLTMKAIWTWVMGKLSGYVPSTRKVNGNPLSADVTIAIPTKVSDLTDGSEYAKSSDVVAKEDGKGLSTNDFTDDDKTDLAEAKEHAESEGNPHNTTADDVGALSVSDEGSGVKVVDDEVQFNGRVDTYGDLYIGGLSFREDGESMVMVYSGSQPVCLSGCFIAERAETEAREDSIAQLGDIPSDAYIASEITGDETVTTLAGVKSALFSSDGFKNATKDAIVQGEGVTITQNADKTITISATGGGGGSSKPSINTFEQLKAYIDAKIADTSFADDAARIAKMKSDLIGIEIPDTWANSGGTIYNDPMIIVNVGKWKGEDNAMHIGAMVMHKYATAESVVFDMANQEVASETTAQEGVYYYGLALGETSVTAAKLTLLELNVGDSLPKSDYKTIYKNSVRDTSRNILQYGHNNWRDSAYRQWLNSFVAKGTSWWTQKHVGQIIPSNAKTIRGYMQGCSGWSGINTDGTAKAYNNGLLKFAKPVYITTSPNYVSDGGNSSDPSVGAYETLDLFFLPSGSEMFGNVNTTGTGGAMVSCEGEFSPYWKEATGFASPSTTYSAARSIFAENGQSAASYVRLRSAYRGNSCHVWYVNASGNLGGSNAYTACAASPACVIY